MAELSHPPVEFTHPRPHSRGHGAGECTRQHNEDHTTRPSTTHRSSTVIEMGRHPHLRRRRQTHPSVDPTRRDSTGHRNPLRWTRSPTGLLTWHYATKQRAPHIGKCRPTLSRCPIGVDPTNQPPTKEPHHDQTNDMDLRLVPRPIHTQPSVAKILLATLQEKRTITAHTQQGEGRDQTGDRDVDRRPRRSIPTHTPARPNRVVRGLLARGSAVTDTAPPTTPKGAKTAGVVSKQHTPQSERTSAAVGERR